MKYVVNILLCLSLLIPLACGKGANIVGQPAPEFSLDLLEGGQIGSTDLRGKPAVLYFFASW